MIRRTVPNPFTQKPASPSQRDPLPCLNYYESFHSEFNRKLTSFDSISLDKIGRDALQDRKDMKYLLPASQVLTWLADLRTAYYAFKHCGHFIQPYRTLYFDSANYKFYFEHHNGVADRYKIRAREYVLSQASYLEIKHKTGNGRTIKHRDKTNRLATTPAAFPHDFLENYFPYPHLRLEPSLWSRFQRVTFVNKADHERVTLDFGLEFYAADVYIPLTGFVIAEVKQYRSTRETKFARLLKTLLVRPSSFSKYCVGIALTHPAVKQNNFKPLLIQIKRLSSGENDEHVL
ncbi:MAG: polyphosphate polymerase domain-containing protein [Anaerolineales bacterium]|nr:polyphosphate polymerase domain-containing protein [Anaerolineales bacterium]